MAAFIFGSLCHLWLGDAWQWGWLPYNLIYLLGLILIWKLGPIFLAWGCCAIGLAGPLLFQRDQLTQSMLLLGMCTLMALMTLIDARRQDPEHRGYWWTIEAWKVMCVGTYALAAIHKINRDFFNPTVSCATYGWDKMLKYWHIDIPLSEPLIALLPWSIIGTELAIALGLAVGLRRWIWPLAIAFHIPLTVTMAPAFAFVMLVGHSAFLTKEDLEHYGQALGDHRWPIAIIGALLTTISLLAHGTLPEWSMIPKEWLLWSAGLLCLIVLKRHPTNHVQRWWSLKRLSLTLIFVAYMLHGLSPYTGLQFQHTGAMLSNLRIDGDCWNSCLFPKAARLTDDYIRIDDAYLHHRDHRPKTVHHLKTHLWSPPQLRQMQRNWCPSGNRPFYLRGTYRGQTFEIQDVCDTKRALPFSNDGVFKINLFPDYLRYQKNLVRTCPQPCIH